MHGVVRIPESRGQSFSSLLAPVDAAPAYDSVPASGSASASASSIVAPDSRLPTPDTRDAHYHTYCMEAGTRRALLARITIARITIARTTM